MRSDCSTVASPSVRYGSLRRRRTTWVRLARAIQVAAFMALGASLTACGGGGSGSAAVLPSNATFAGQYRLMGFSVSQASGLATGFFARTTGDGAGEASEAMMYNENGANVIVFGSTPVAYSVGADGSMSYDGATGGISRDGRLAALADVRPGSTPRILLLMRASPLVNDATMTGLYHMGGYMSVDSSELRARWTDSSVGLVDFDGMGGVTLPWTTTNLDGLVSGGVGGGASTYAVDADGHIDTAATWVGEGRGGLLATGDFAAVAGSRGGGMPFVQCFVRQGAGLSASVMQGEYWVVGISSDPVTGNACRTFRATAVLDGAGGIDYDDYTVNEEGAISEVAALGTYAVAGDGTFSISAGYGVGGVSQDGAVAFASGATTAPGAPFLVVFIRK